MSPKLFLTSMCGANDDNASEMVRPIIQWLDGIIWVVHTDNTNDSTVQWLGATIECDLNGCGRVIQRGWPARHWHSMNDTLFTDLIQEGDFIIWSDALERPAPSFVSRIKSEIGPMMNEADLDAIVYYGKPFIIRYRETMEYRGSPHWYLMGHNGRMMEWSQIEPDEKMVRVNVRPQKRPDPWDWISHYVKYYVAYPAGSNHCLLGLEKNGDPNKLFPPREARRLEFRRYLRKLQIPLTVEGVKSWMTKCNLDDQGKRFVNEEKILNDAYRYWVLKDTTLVDNHDFRDMIVIP